ncbi:MAG TPA: UDP-N-acetylmuramoyl-L-alanine--D-glutamate ligase [Candidatus Saccharimonadales bacterium]|nr:UDP-N-acetylmuramoyl-L-alanine--D-glutamate ligase [Candidatus Saccharimonadales bacterium]
MKVAIIGYGIEGRSALHYWQDKGAEITVCKRSNNVQLPKGVNARFGDHHLEDLGGFDVIMRTAGVPPSLITAKNPGIEAKITTVVDEFIKVSPTRNIIGVTGTKGKGTTSMLIAKMLEAAGKQAFLGGNYGISPLDFLPELTADSWVVLELSSFQLFDVKHSPHIAVCLMIAQEHMDWHTDMNDYIRAKSQLFAHQTDKDVAIYFADDDVSHRIASASPGDKIAYYDEPGAYIHNNQIMIDQTVLCKTNELKLLGKHNWQNACAAATAVWQVMQVPGAIRTVLTTFNGLEHRLEFVREVDGVKYYDDSFGTTPETAQVAIAAFHKPKVIILGGSDKGSSYDKLAATVAKSNVRAVVVIGDMAAKITTALHEAGFMAITPGGQTMLEIVATAHSLAKKGDVVLLSTACASFDMFKNYKDRGIQFKAAVQAL